MVAGSFSVDMESSVEAKRLWNATVKDSHNLLPKLAPQTCAGVTLLQGDGGVGTIRQVNFTSANKDFSYVKERIDEVGEAYLVYSFSQVEGGVIGTKLASAQYKVEFNPKAEGGCIVTYTCNFDSLPGVDPYDEDKVKDVKKKSTGLLKLIEAYLIANPTLYC